MTEFEKPLIRRVFDRFLSPFNRRRKRLAAFEALSEQVGQIDSTVGKLSGEIDQFNKDAEQTLERVQDQES